MAVAALILAAGEGTRMKSSLPKVAHEVLGVPMVQLVIDAAIDAGCDRVVAVTGHGAEIVESLIGDVACVRQDEQLGTGHAVMCARDELGDHGGSLLVLSGDTPLLRAETIRELVEAREATGAAVSLLTTRMPDPSGYGRVVRETDGSVTEVVEHKDATEEQLRIDEINTGTYCFDADVLFEHLDRLETANSQGEYYLTDMVGIFRSEGLRIAASVTDDPSETIGVNSRVQLAEASATLQARINERHMVAGVTMIAPDLTWVGPHVVLGRDIIIEPMSFLVGETLVEDGVHIGPNARVVDSRVAEGARIDSSVVIRSQIGRKADVGPSAYLRPGTVLHEGAKAGTHVEIKNSHVGEGSKVPHLSYIGDAQIGKGVNVGAGTITCNYDGTNKHPTIIEDGVFIGSDTMLIAPVHIGRGAIVGAASAISEDVPADALGIERSDQRNLEGWARRRREQAARDKEEGDTEA